MFELLWSQTWWEYHPKQGWEVYHFFNLFEGVCWCVLGVLVAIRFLKFKRAGIELVYAAAFVAFGLTDFREAWVLQTWLIWVKGLNLLALFSLRQYVMKRYYPESKLF